ncbi:hypothetical protein [Shimia sagamensis]|uniref:Glycine zipper family protein n=1 Tax=Shimia sagamensis TaxID=1566352 RepID=A0ABY1NLJ8_9RHOB|nr:hypothetical protein [Shimia sagamensis]SMP12981.1 hypothetical protein SAMN06265373_102425 [Shimia sagamensis]
MRPALALILILFLPATDTLAQARKDSARHQNNFMSPESQQARPQKRQTPDLHQWPQTQQRTQLFCDQYARAATGMRGTDQGSRTGTSLGQGAGYIGTRDRTQAEAFGMIGGAIGSAAGNAQDQQFYQFHFHECMNGGRLVTTPR